MQIYFAQEARVYALLPLAFGLALLGLLRFLAAPDDRGRAGGSGALALYAAGMLVLLYAHATSVLHRRGVGRLRRAGPAADPAQARGTAPASSSRHLAIGLLALPLAIPILAQAGRHDLELDPARRT